MRVLTLVGAVAALAVSSLPAQTLLDRPPNLGGTWVPDDGVVRFDFLHRFWVTPGPAKSVVNYPTFTLAVGLPSRLALGLRYSTRSEVLGETNETEFYGRWQVLGGSRPVRVSVTPAFNSAAQSFDGELSADWTRGRLTLVAAARAMTQAYGEDRSRGALAGGAVLLLNDFVALAGDFASLVNPDPGEDPAWSGGLLFVIPGSPHTFSLHVSNVDVNTIQGSSREGLFRLGTKKPLYGFEFTIPLHLKRFSPWFKGGRAAVPPAAEPGVAAEVRINAFRFRTDTITIAAGQAVRWTNEDPVDHTVTFVSGATSSGLLPAKGSFTVRFDRRGTYEYHCTPHPYMKGVVIVR